MVVARAFLELGGALVVVLERLRGEERQVLERQCHRVLSIPWGESDTGSEINLGYDRLCDAELRNRCPGIFSTYVRNDS
jgi:hypothetical protein